MDLNPLSNPASRNHPPSKKGVLENPDLANPHWSGGPAVCRLTVPGFPIRPKASFSAWGRSGGSFERLHRQATLVGAPPRWHVLQAPVLTLGWPQPPALGLHGPHSCASRMPTGRTVYGDRLECRGERPWGRQKMDRSPNQSLAG